MPKSTATIDDAIGFDKPFVSGRGGSETGNRQSEIRDSKPERPVEGSGSKVEHVNGYAAVSPFDIDNAGTDNGSGDGRDTGIYTGRTDASEPRRRGRPPGSRNKTKETVPPNLANLEDILFSIHLFASGLVSEMELEKSECKDYSDALKEVARHYSFVVDPKKMALINLAAVMGRLYVPRGIAAYRRIIADEKKPEVKTASKPQAVPTPIRVDVPKVAPNPVVEPVPQTPRPSGAIEVPSQIWSEGGDTSFTEMAE